MAKKPGSLWVEGAELHYVDSISREWFLQGELGGASGAKPGALWIGTDGYLYYVGANGLKYRVWWQTMHTDAASTKANVWIDGNYLFHSYGSTKYWEHGDYSHADGASGHTDVPHGDGHTDSTHGDSHTDSHTDSSHGDSHVDASHGDSPHYDSHGDLSIYRDKFCTYYDHGVVVGHEDHGDSGAHTDGLNHCDTHDDYAPVSSAHGDQHSDGSHGDSHNDVAHQDGSHGDSHSDTVHQDAAHSDGAASHLDTPALIGP